MPGAKEVRSKIFSVKNTQKITSAMQMVAASKMRKAQERMEHSRPYTSAMLKLIGHIARAHLEYKHPYTVERPIKNVGYIIVSTDRGLCGGLNINLFTLIAVGLGDRLEHKSNQMSGGQMQRVAIARALVNDPAVILADEATGNLDTRTSFEILVLFQKLHAEGRTIIFVTHNPDIAMYSSRNIRLRDGKVVEDKRNENILSAKDTLDKLPVSQDD